MRERDGERGREKGIERDGEIEREFLLIEVIMPDDAKWLQDFKSL